MLQTYGVDLRPALEADPPRVARLAAQLPPSSRVMRAEDPRLAWGDAEWLLAAVADNLALLRYELAGCRGRPPRMTPRPQAPGRQPAGARRARTREEVMGALSAPRT